MALTDFLEATETVLAACLAEWITAENIPGRYAPDVLAAFMLTQFGEAYITAWLDGDTGWLRSACGRYVHHADLTLSQWAHEEARDGHLREDMQS